MLLSPRCVPLQFKRRSISFLMLEYVFTTLRTLLVELSSKEVNTYKVLKKIYLKAEAAVIDLAADIEKVRREAFSEEFSPVDASLERKQ
ncbi:hypothetical protein TNIN_433621 [Trichonephila inaurata madagascariensis]|uniref:Uncharacterized protein n=1 Tax=Trichonephila inaurata madagascariensis TaxID=2747483 RepID=A0A8X6I908_9ARAC|nr:hypothetical protein TNIN_50041 [Trichonephila inaurata madagascariensis]GFY61212.1 hypothetical protein TNIN_433621 [Trichonephila inaurata madagascariensis]